jgi:hypothetical protein
MEGRAAASQCILTQQTCREFEEDGCVASRSAKLVKETTGRSAFAAEHVEEPVPFAFTAVCSLRLRKKLARLLGLKNFEREELALAFAMGTHIFSFGFAAFAALDWPWIGPSAVSWSSRCVPGTIPHFPSRYALYQP